MVSLYIFQSKILTVSRGETSRLKSGFDWIRLEKGKVGYVIKHESRGFSFELTVKTWIFWLILKGQKECLGILRLGFRGEDRFGFSLRSGFGLGWGFHLSRRIWNHPSFDFSPVDCKDKGAFGNACAEKG